MFFYQFYIDFSLSRYFLNFGFDDTEKKKMVRIGAMGLVRFLPRQSEIQHSAQHRIFKKKKRMATKMIRDFRCHFLSFSNAWGCGIWTPKQVWPTDETKLGS